MIFRSRTLTLWGCIALFVFPMGAQAFSPPVTPVGTTSESYFGTVVPDPYRWMEDMNNPEFLTWTHKQTDYAEKMLALIPGRDRLSARITELSNASDVIHGAKLAAKNIFYLQRESKHHHFRLLVRDSTGVDRVLLDPETLPFLDGHQSINFFSPSPDGKLVVIGLSHAGSRSYTLRIINVQSGALLLDTIEGANFNDVSVGWHSGSQAFFYNHLRPGSKKGEWEYFGKSVVRDHVVGQAPEQDRAVFGYGVTIKRHFSVPDLPQIITSADSVYALAIVRHGDESDKSIYVAPLSTINGTNTPWRKIAGPEDEVHEAYLHGGLLYLLSHKNAPHFRLLRISLAQPDISLAKIIVQANSAVLRSAAIANDALYLNQFDDGSAQLLRIPYDDQPSAIITLPFKGTISEMSADPQSAGVMIKLEGWLDSPQYLNINADSAVASNSGLLKASPISFSEMETKRVLVNNPDGIAIPLSLIYKKGISLDSNNPTILYAYGAYGFSVEPDFSPKRLAWLERGGVYAVAHVRGGGELGEEWHEGAHILNKMNSIQDFIACSEYLIHQGYTSPKRLAAVGNGAGGITVEGAMARRPDLFAAIHSAMGISDMLRMELTSNGASNVTEFGTVRKKNQFIAMLGVSPYHQLRNGLAYPGIILTMGVIAPDIESWQSAKFAARLQATTSSGRPVLLKVDEDTGYQTISTKSETATDTANVWSFFLSQMGFQDFLFK